jgi:hypothetical protein
VHEQAWIADYVQIKSTTQVLMTISAHRVEQRSTRLYEKLLKHTFGHVLRSLRYPSRPNECYHATREWNKWTKIIRQSEIER